MKAAVIRAIIDHPYALGCATVFMACFLWYFGVAATSIDRRILAGLMFGTPLWALLLVPHGLMQFVLGRLMTKRLNLSKTISAMVMVAPAGILLLVSSLAAYVGSTPRALFERYVMNPMPTSVRNIRVCGAVGVDSSWVFAFEVSYEDFQELVAHRDCRFTNSLPSSRVVRSIENRLGLPVLQPEKFMSYSHLAEEQGLEWHFLRAKSNDITFYYYASH